MKKLCLLWLCLALGSGLHAQHTFSLGDSTFLLDGKDFQMISGEMHYTRIPREAWRQRLHMARAMGLNTIGTYVFWNVHEPEKGKFDFTGNNDIAAFVRMAKEEGLYVVLRPSPYVCAEWEFGGYPYWLQNEKGLVVRSQESKYVKEYAAYLKAVGRQLQPLLVTHGGNILMVQIENEYGSYGHDSVYLAMNRDLFRRAGFDGILFTCDPAGALPDGHLRGLMPAVNGSETPEHIKSLVRKYHDGKGPFYVAEWYPAWFDWWGAAHHRVNAAFYAGKLDTLLGAGISVNMYMFHGGTTRGFMNGANYSDESPYEPQISSYDYDAPLDEAGNATEKFRIFRAVIEKHLPAGTSLPPVPAAKPVISIPPMELKTFATLGQLVSAPVSSGQPLTFEQLHQPYGFVLYRTTVQGGAGLLKIPGLRDYAVIMANGRTIATLDRRHAEDSIQLELPQGTVQLDILVENLGRINFGPYLLKNEKGIVGNVYFQGRALRHWQQFQLPFNNVPTSARGRATGDQPVLKKATFTLTQTGDTYLDMRNWGKGIAWINGHNLGRYWQVGPQQTLYVPAAWLKKGSNEVVVFELLKPGNTTLEGIDHAILDVLKK
ncbi:beta-galactosidase [Chitinophaga parva]|uniref:Beta-galactosidase n=1 Tax=Chitinophaga parva TaxID=2169414 RepID=A0A2T7BJN7_9BACT|nr:beta-galactosidase family protein [Chitinophaga parva]PUZ26472.1 beta-galactosidase [Chitinophaga parva]